MNREMMIGVFLRAEPSWHLIDSMATDPATVQGPVVIVGSTGVEYRFVVSIAVPGKFPERGAHPRARLIESPFPFALDGHVLGDGSLCVQLPVAHELDYGRVGLVGFFEQVVLHLDRFVIYSLTGEYPGRAYAHGTDGVREFLRELPDQLPLPLRRFVKPGIPIPPDRQWCPCGASCRFHECHKPALKTLRAAYVEAGGRPRPRAHGPASRRSP